jgi:hypothetical protein
MLMLLASPIFAGESRVQLIPRISISKPANWAAPIVPHLSTGVTSDSALVFPSSLTQSQATYFNYAESYNPAVQGYWTDQMTLDGVVIQTVMRYNGTWASGSAYSFDVGPFYMAGGRHVITANCDINNDVGEDTLDRYDNFYTASFLWTPPNLTAGVVAGGHTPPPQPGNTAFAMPRTSSAPWLVTLGMSAGDDYDLVLFDDFTNCTDGLSHERARSATVGDSLELIAGAGNVTPGTLYPTVLRSSVGPAWGAAVEWQTANPHVGTGEDFWGAESLGTIEAARIYEVDLQAGIQYPMSAWRVVGVTPLAFAVFPPTPGAVFNLRQAAAYSHPVAGQDYAALAFTPTVSGKHLLVVYRSNAPWEVARYKLAVGSQAVSAPTGAPRPEEARILGVQPNPARDHVRISFATPGAGTVRLTLHDVTGRRVATLADGELDAGRHDMDVPTRDEAGRALPAGLYWARMETGRHVSTARVAIIR